MADGTMTDAAFLIGLAAMLAACSAAAFVCAVFFPALATPAASRGEVFKQILQRAGRRAATATTRSARNAQAIALKLVAEERRTRDQTRLDQKLAHAGLNWSSQRYVIWVAAFSFGVFLLGFALRLPFGGSLASALLAAVFVPPKILGFLARRRQQRFLAGFAGAVDMIVRGARSGMSVTDCLGMVASDATAAVKLEFVPLVAQLRAGVPLTTAIEKLAFHMPVAEVRFFALVVTIQSQTGGNFTEALANLAGVLRERARLAAKVRTASAEVRASAITIGVLPFLVAGATAVLAPDYISVLWREEAGRKLAAYCIVWLILGITVLRRMARIEA